MPEQTQQMSDFLDGKTDISPLTGNKLRPNDAAELRRKLTFKADEAVGQQFAYRVDPKTGKRLP